MGLTKSHLLSAMLDTTILPHARIRHRALHLGALVLFVSFAAATPAAASPVYAEARLHGALRHDGTTLADRQDLPFDIGGTNATAAQVNQALPETQATGTMDTVAGHVAMTIDTTSSHTSHTEYDRWHRRLNVIDSRATGMATLTAEFSSTYEIGSATLAAGTPVTVDLLWNLVGSVSQSQYSYAGIHFDTSGKTGALGGGSPNLYSFNHLQDWAVGKPHDGTNRLFGDITGGSATIDTSFTGSESLKVGDIFTIGATFVADSYSTVVQQSGSLGSTWAPIYDGWGNADLDASLNLSSASDVVFNPLAVPEPASLPLIASALVGIFAFARRRGPAFSFPLRPLAPVGHRP